MSHIVSPFPLHGGLTSVKFCPARQPSLCARCRTRHVREGFWSIRFLPSVRSTRCCRASRACSPRVPSRVSSRRECWLECRSCGDRRLFDTWESPRRPSSPPALALSSWSRSRSATRAAARCRPRSRNACPDATWGCILVGRQSSSSVSSRESHCRHFASPAGTGCGRRARMDMAYSSTIQEVLTFQLYRLEKISN